MREVAKAAGADAGRALGQADSAFASGRLQRADADAARMNVQGTPTITVKRGDGPERVLKASPLDAAAVQAELDRGAADEGRRDRRRARRPRHRDLPDRRALQRRRGVGTAAAFLSLAGLGFSAWLTYADVGVLHAICIWCVSPAVCTALLTALTVVRLLREPGMSLT